MYHSEITAINFSTSSTLSNWQNWEEAKSLLEILYAGSVRRLTKKIDESINEMQKRNKSIRLAHRLAGG